LATQVQGPSGPFNEKTQGTINALCDWITDKTKNGASSEELKALPEVTKATADLINTIVPSGKTSESFAPELASNFFKAEMGPGLYNKITNLVISEFTKANVHPSLVSDFFSHLSRVYRQGQRHL
jgi:hypothetical protein